MNKIIDALLAKTGSLTPESFWTRVAWFSIELYYFHWVCNVSYFPEAIAIVLQRPKTMFHSVMFPEKYLNKIYFQFATLEIQFTFHFRSKLLFSIRHFSVSNMNCWISILRLLLINLKTHQMKSEIERIRILMYFHSPILLLNNISYFFLLYGQGTCLIDIKWNKTYVFGISQKTQIFSCLFEKIWLSTRLI